MITNYAKIIYTDAYGFDSATSCDPKHSRRSKALLISSIPCDLSQTGYCNEPGRLYPWNAVRRFVNENQGLMKRMYGDLKHKSLLKSEMNGNKVDDYDIESRAKFYSRTDKHLRQEYSELISEPHFRLTTTTTTMKNPFTTLVSHKSEITTPKNATEIKSVNRFEQNQIYDNKKKSDIHNVSLEIIPDNIEIIKAPDLFVLNSSDSQQISTTLKKNHFSHIEESTIKIYTNKSIDVKPDDKQLFEETTKSSMYNTNSLSTTEKITSNTKATTNIPNDIIKESITKENKQPALTVESEGQLYQDHVQKDNAHYTQHFRGKGVNACPIKEEVVAPFWANNTRGEILALLNLYPFEQYVHWEKCTHEDKQMYCRDGCRCEQQYSLHRLLAYDPNNDCRGIFSDWFRFPSCCVCKCYNIPGSEYRGTSRSPRSDSTLKHPIDIAEDNLRQAIYEHASEIWYPPKEEYEDD